MPETQTTAEPVREVPATEPTWKRTVWNLFLLTAGNLVYALGINAIIIPQKFLSGGVIGGALIFYYLFPFRWADPGIGYFILNIPLFLLGWFSISRRFILYSLYGVASLSALTALVHPGTIHIANPILAAILGGIICGTGVGIALRSQGSMGGLDILAVYLNRKFSVRIGNTSALVSVTVLALGAYIFDLDRALYSLIFVFTVGKVVDSVLTGFNQRKSVLIVSDHYQEISDQILKKLNRGVTFLDGTGAYSGRERKVIFSIIALSELSKMKELVFDVDPSAFVVVNDTLEVMGYRHGALKGY